MTSTQYELLFFLLYKSSFNPWILEAELSLSVLALFIGYHIKALSFLQNSSDTLLSSLCQPPAPSGQSGEKLGLGYRDIRN